MNARWWSFALASVFLMTPTLGACAPAESTSPTEPTTAAEAPLVLPTDQPSFVYPQRREVDDYSIVIHAPQIRSWLKFETFEALFALELTPPDGSGVRYGTATVTGGTEVDLPNRIVKVTDPTVDEVLFSGELKPEHVAVVKAVVTHKQLEMPLDLFLANLADDVLSSPPPPGFNTDPPAIHVASKPTLLLFVNGDPVLVDVADTPLKVVANANWPTFQATGDGAGFYVLDTDLWLHSTKLDGKWSAAKALPAAFEKIPADGDHAAVRAAVPLKKSAKPIPAVIVTGKPAELIVTEGKPKLEPVPGAGKLQAVTNTESPLFKLDKTWYFLVAGRWFTATNLTKGPWTYAPELPEVFAQIPDDSTKASVRASVPGTVEAKTAALEALLPTKATAQVGAAPPVEVTYAGEPTFEPIKGTSVARAANSGYDIIEYQGKYYLCYAGVWYLASSPTGPFKAASSVPDAIYAIPPNSPSYPVTQVTVVQSTPTTVVYSYPPAYTSSVYVVYGVPYYGTGWYYPPYIYGGHYYPYWGSYGHGSWYNPVTGGYGSRSAWYGPYGGYSYTQGYNPRTGRYGYVETAWDGDEWASYGEKFNPRTGVYTETSRHYNEDKEQLHTERTRQRGNEWTTMDRTVDVDGQVSEVRRQSSSGASSQVKREWGDGTMTSSGTVTGADGRTATISGEQHRGGGSSTITGSGGNTVDTSTERQGGKSRTDISTSGGGRGVSVSGEGPGRTTIGQSGSGDLYAGHNGNVFKKTDDGWSQYQDGNWNQVDTPQRRENASPRTGEAANRANSGQIADYSKQLESARASQQGWGGAQERPQQRASGGGQSRMSQSRSASQRDMSRLNRDFSARQRGTSNFQRRGGGFQRGGGGRGGGGRRR